MTSSYSNVSEAEAALRKEKEGHSKEVKPYEDYLVELKKKLEISGGRGNDWRGCSTPT